MVMLFDTERAGLFTNCLATSFADKITASGIDGSITVGAALPCRSALGRNIEVFYLDKSLKLLIIDVGPWNINDPYWEYYGKGVPRVQLNKNFIASHLFTKYPLGALNHAGLDLTRKAWEKFGIPVNKSRLFSAVVKWKFI